MSKKINFSMQNMKVIPKKDCFICKRKINEEDIIYEDKKFIAFLDLYPPTKGYTLLATKRHVEDITDLSKEDYLKFQRILFRISKAIKKTFKIKRIAIMQTGGILPHLHFHIIPIYGEFRDKFMDIFLKKSIILFSKNERKIISDKIKRNLSKK